MFEGLRLLQPDAQDPARADELILPCLRANVTVNASAIDVFSHISNFTNSINLKAGLIQSIRMVAHIDNNTDILHIKLQPVFLYPTWTGPRCENFTRIRWFNADLLIMCAQGLLRDALLERSRGVVHHLFG